VLPAKSYGGRCDVNTVAGVDGVFYGMCTDLQDQLWEYDMLWHSASIEPQRLMPRGEAAISVAPKGFVGLVVSRIHGFDRDMGGCRS